MGKPLTSMSAGALAMLNVFARMRREKHPGKMLLQIHDELEEAAEKLRVSKEAADKADKWPHWRRRPQIDEEACAWRSVKDRGQRLWDTHTGVCFRVSLGTYERALSIVNALALAAPARGFSVREDEERG